MDINHNIIYDKFLMIEGWAYRGKIMVEKDVREKYIECFNRIEKEMKELSILLKQDELIITEKKDN